jgi:DNA-binding NarL/FixJ family response regulator
MANYYLTRDLFFSSQVLGAAQQAGIELQMIPSVEKLTEQLAVQPCGLLILDITIPEIPFGDLVTLAKALNPHTFIVAYGPHVHTGLLQAATDAGCNLVWSRGQFNASFRDLFVHAQVSEPEA